MACTGEYGSVGNMKSETHTHAFIKSIINERDLCVFESIHTDKLDKNIQTFKVLSTDIIFQHKKKVRI